MSDLANRIGRLSQDKQALLREMLRRKGLDDPSATHIRRVADRSSYPLSFAQRRLWFLDQMAPGNPFYNEPLLAVRIKGGFDPDAFRRTIAILVERHESLRTSFANVDGRPAQVVAANASVPITEIDLRELPPPEREAELRTLAEKEASLAFDLARGPLLRVSLIRVGDEYYTVFIAMHHIITDGWSNRLLLREMMIVYAALSKGQPNPLPELPIRYVDFAVWQAEWLTGKTLDRLVGYWTRQLGGNLPLCELPADFPRPAVQRYVGRLETRVVDPETSDAIRRLAKQRDCTLFMVLFAAFVALLHRYTGQDDIVVGVPVANRNRGDTEAVIGFFVNTLVFRSDVSENPRFGELLLRVRNTALDAFAHEDMPFERLVEILRPERNLDRQALFQIIFVVHNYPDKAEAIDLGGESLALDRIEIDGGDAKVDLAFSITDLEQDGIKVQVNYNTDLYKPSTMRLLVTQYEAILRHVAAEPDILVNAIPVFANGADCADRTDGSTSVAERLKSVRRQPVPIQAKGGGQ